MSAWHESTGDWLSVLHERLGHERALVRVVVAAIKGSAPREAGACMIVSLDTQYGTIGGGHLEYTAIDHARSMLAADGARARVDRFVLGATLGQCCGGVVELVFDRYEADDRALLQRAIDMRAEGRPVVLSSSLGAIGEPRRMLHGANEPPGAADDAASSGLGDAVRVLLAAGEHAVRAALVEDRDGRAGALVERIDDSRIVLWIFGAGHVGSALVRVFATLPFTIAWVDDRDDAFPADVPANVTAIASDDPVADVRDAPPGTHFLVLTHSHDLDFELCRAILARADAASLGLIGSASKSARFRRRLTGAGAPASRVDAMRCPIGVGGIDDKRPGVIAVAVAAELLQIVQARAAASTDVPAAARSSGLR